MGDKATRFHPVHFENINKQLEELKCKQVQIVAQKRDLQIVRHQLETQYNAVKETNVQIKSENTKLHERVKTTRQNIETLCQRAKNIGIKIQEQKNSTKHWSNTTFQEQNEFTLWIRQWGKQMSDLSEQFFKAARLFQEENVTVELEKSKEREIQLNENTKEIQQAIENFTNMMQAMKLKWEGNKVLQFLVGEEATTVSEHAKKYQNELECSLKEQERLSEEISRIKLWMDNDEVTI
uniref:Uncharacterized protein n=1 Tax=Ciona intestinalis TaxID=7719 RepID=F6YWY1_CIOIN|nr:uncharacterized protein PFB0765w-like isoform X3 [Ciona intestinalis]|eukprot:XP_002129446.1 uncharacterized protein PFB0765w-like isoform X3 [Ciona intestinalis]